jgi:LysM repeat protein
MLKKIITIWILLFAFALNAQTYTKHTVAKGETLIQIAQKYKVTPYDIYRINPDSQGGLKPNMVLLIPTTTVSKNPIATDVKTPTKPNADAKTHQVAAKETIYGIAKQYGITVDELNKKNPTIATDGLKIGQIITISGKPVTPKPTVPKAIIASGLHEVLAKETKYSIAKKYGITIEKLEKLNPEIKDGLKIGNKLIVSDDFVKKEDVIVPADTKPVVKEVVIKTPKVIDYVNYEVKSKETLYSLSRKFGIKQDDLIAANPELSNGVQEGMTIKVPSTVAIKEENNKQIIDFTKSIKQTGKKQLAILLPFNISKIQGDTINSQQQRLKKDGFLNMTLDFYSGALMAIDSARTLGVNVGVKILDSQETKTSSNVENLVSENNLQDYNAIIGPFYQSHSDKIASLLEKNNVPVISPLSKESGKSHKNMYSTMPSSDFVKNAMFDFMKEKNGNVVAVIDAKKTAIKQYISDNQKEVKIANLDEKGTFVPENLKILLVKDKINYIVMATEKTGTIVSITNTLIKSLSDFQIRLVILEPNETLDFEEITLNSLTKLKLTYPSLTGENDSDGSKIFEKNYKKKNKIFPNQYATRGFDLTFDTLLRLSQDQSFEETINDSASEQVENKFDYSKKISGGYVNKGVYILQYNSDLTISNAE